MQARADRDVTLPTVKTCRSCSEIKSSASYHRNRAALDGLQAYCIDCSRIMARQSSKRNAEAIALRQAEKKARTPDPSGKKVCNKCHIEQPILAFYAHRGTKDGRGTYCMECEKKSSRQWKKDNAERVRAQNAQAAAAADPVHKSRYQRHVWLRMYGLTPETYDQMSESQDGCCAICRLPERGVDQRTGNPRKLAVDHDHKSFKVRGLLCMRCNQALGCLEDDEGRLRAAIAYLEAARG